MLQPSEYDNALANFAVSLIKAAEAIMQAFNTLVECVRRIIAPFFEAVADIQPDRTDDESTHIPPRLTPHMQSWAYYSAPFYRYKRAYRKQRTWRNLR